MQSSSQYLSSLIVAIRTNDGYCLWRTQLAQQEIADPSAQQGIIYAIYAVKGQEELFALSAADGSSLWHRTLYSIL